MYNPFNPPIEAIIGSLNNTVAKLEKFVAKADAACVTKAELAQLLMAEAKAHTEEANRAARVVSNIRKLIA